jgi:ABC-type transport system involved in multi-copper enzyme maturation permease subunit
MQAIQQIRTISYYTLLEALRNRLIWLVVAVALAGVCITGFLNELALTEGREIQLALLASFLRFSAVFLVATFVVTSIVREFNDKGLELALALPLPRYAYLFGKIVGFAALALLPAMLFGMLTALLAPLEQSLLWTISLVCECWIVAAFSVLCVLTFSQNMTALSAVMGFYLLARSISALQLIGTGPLTNETMSQRVINFVIDGISIILPHLDTFTRTDWLVYGLGDWTVIARVLGQCAIYVTLLSGASLFDLYRKNI